jgi:DNA-binding transcriptional regulator LsrR (DeoR family)
MTRQSADEAARKADRALELYEKGLKKGIIAERLGVNHQHISGMLQRARERREKAKEGAE